jgi:hypothetical protein
MKLLFFYVAVFILSPVLALATDCIPYSSTETAQQEYIIQKGDYLSKILFSFKFNGQSICLYKNRGWLSPNKLQNPKIQDWTNLQPGVSLLLVLPKVHEPLTAPEDPQAPIEEKQVPEVLNIPDTLHQVVTPKEDIPIRFYYNVNLGPALLANNLFQMGRQYRLDLGIKRQKLVSVLRIEHTQSPKFLSIPTQIQPFKIDALALAIGYEFDIPWILDGINVEGIFGIQRSYMNIPSQSPGSSDLVINHIDESFTIAGYKLSAHKSFSFTDTQVHWTQRFLMFSDDFIFDFYRLGIDTSVYRAPEKKYLTKVYIYSHLEGMSVGSKSNRLVHLQSQKGLKIYNLSLGLGASL